MELNQADPPTTEPAFHTLGQAPAPETTIFTGPLGLRAGWGILLFLLLSVVLVSLLFFSLFRASGQLSRAKQERAQRHQQTAAAQAAHQHPPAPQLGLVDVSLAETAEAGAVLSAGLILSYVERRRFGVYGLPARRLRDVLPGAAVGLVAISLLVGLLRALHLLVFDRQLLTGTLALQFGLKWMGAFALVGIFEEFLFRGYLQFTLMRGLLSLGESLSAAHPRRAAFWLTALLLSAGFGATHLSNAGEDPVGIVMVFGAGVLFSYALWRTGSLWWGVGFHMTWDWGQSFLFGVPDSGSLSTERLFATHPQGNALLSGGVAGPEGSVFVLPVLLLVAVVIRMHPRASQPPVEPTSPPPPGKAITAQAIP